MRAQKLGLSVEPVSTQVIPRDRHAMFFATLGVIMSSLEWLAARKSVICNAPRLPRPRNTGGRRASSAMPHKRNPVLSENLAGLSRMVRAYVYAGARKRRALA